MSDTEEALLDVNLTKLYEVSLQGDEVQPEYMMEMGFLNKKLEDLTVYDIVSVTEEDLAIVHCMKEDCGRNTDQLCQPASGPGGFRVISL